jgi:hypothetical protein
VAGGACEGGREGQAVSAELVVYEFRVVWRNGEATSSAEGRITAPVAMPLVVLRSAVCEHTGADPKTFIRFDIDRVDMQPRRWWQFWRSR